MTYRIDHIPVSTPHSRRAGHIMTPTTITIHNTGNPKSTAANERAWLTSPDNDRTASYHIVIDDKETIECLPLNENAWHSGDGSGPKSGNRTSIGIEICESGDYTKTLERAADLVAKMLRERGWGVDRLRRHYDWPRPSDGYRKICPRLMYDNGKWTGWSEFKAAVAAKLVPKPVPAIPVVTKPKSEPTVVKTWDAALSSVNIVVDGKPIDSAHITDGVSYAPVKTVAEAVAKLFDGNIKVTWDGESRSVVIERK